MVDSKIIEDIFSSSRSKSKESKRPNLSIPSKDEAFNHADTANSSSPFIKSCSLEELPLSLDRDDHEEVDLNLSSSQSVLRSIRSVTPVDLPISSEMPCCLLEEDEETEDEMIASLATPLQSPTATPIIATPTLAVPTTGLTNSDFIDNDKNKKYKTDELSMTTSSSIKTDLHFHKKPCSSTSSGNHKETFFNSRSFKIPIITPTPVSIISLRTTPILNPVSTVPIPIVTPVSTVTPVASISTVSIVPVSTVLRVSTRTPPTIVTPVSSTVVSIAQATGTSMSDQSLLLSALNYCSMTSQYKIENKMSKKRDLEPCSSSSPTQDSVMTAQTRSILRDFLYKQQNSADSQSAARGCKLNGHLPSTTATVQLNTADISPIDVNPSKRQKLKSSKPHPPLTSYGTFLRESQSDFTGSSQDVAKKLGLVWSSMSESMKEEYNTKSQVDQYRYTRELKDFLWQKFEDCVEYPVFSRLVDDTIASTEQYNNAQLSCSLCHISFSNLYRKNSHFCGRPHSNELLTKLIQVLEESSRERNDDSFTANGREEENNSLECLINDSSVSQTDEHSNSTIVSIDLTGGDDDSSCEEESDFTDDEDYCNVQYCSTEVCDDLKPSPEYRPALRDAHQVIDNMEANAQSLELEKSNHLELMNCYIHLLEQESEIQEWSLAYDEAIEDCLKQLQANKESLKRLLNLIDKCRVAAVNDPS